MPDMSESCYEKGPARMVYTKGADGSRVFLGRYPTAIPTDNLSPFDVLEIMVGGRCFPVVPQSDGRCYVAPSIARQIGQGGKNEN